jgi:hypothetical protein
MPVPRGRATKLHPQGTGKDCVMRVSHKLTPKSRGGPWHAPVICRRLRNTEPQGASLQVGTLGRLQHSPYHRSRSARQKHTTEGRPL